MLRTLLTGSSIASLFVLVGACAGSAPGGSPPPPPAPSSSVSVQGPAAAPVGPCSTDDDCVAAPSTVAALAAGGCCPPWTCSQIVTTRAFMSAIAARCVDPSRGPGQPTMADCVVGDCPCEAPRPVPACRDGRCVDRCHHTGPCRGMSPPSDDPMCR